MASPEASSSLASGRQRLTPPAAVSLVARLRGYSWGALLGVAVTGALTLGLPVIHGKPWLELPLAMLCVAAGMLLERAARYFLSAEIDSWVQHLAARREADRELRKLRAYRKSRLIPEPEARRIAARISKRDVQGGKKPGHPRGPYRKRSAVTPPPEPTTGLPPQSEKPAA